MKKVRESLCISTDQLAEIWTVFAPIATILTYETIEEAVAIANGTRYGLGASVFGTHQDECYKVAQRLEVGMVAINDFASFYVCFLFVPHFHGLTWIL